MYTYRIFLLSNIFSLLISAVVCVGGCRLWRVGVWGPLCLAHYSVSPAILTSGNWQVGEGGASGEAAGRRKGRKGKGGKGKGEEKRKRGVRGGERGRVNKEGPNQWRDWQRVVRRRG